MKKCLICNREVEENIELCESCQDFLKWKHKKNSSRHIEKLKHYFSKKSIKFGRAR